MKPRRITALALAGVLSAGAASAAAAAAASTRAAQSEPNPGLGDQVMAWFASNPSVAVDRSCVNPSTRTEPLAYRTDRLIVRAPATAPVASAVDAALRSLVGTPPASSWVDGIDAVKLPAVPGAADITPVLSVRLHASKDARSQLPIVALARLLRTQGLTASPDYAIAPSGGYVFFWPNGAPQPAAALDPQRTITSPSGKQLGTGVRVAVYDTGLAPNVHPALLSKVGVFKAFDKENPDQNHDTFVDYPAAGHGLAISGVLATLDAGVSVKVARISDSRGLATDLTAASRIFASLASTPSAKWPSVLVNSFGTPACDLVPAQSPTDARTLEPLALEAVAELVARAAGTQKQGMILVAAAGNRGTTRPFYPAAFAVDPRFSSTVVSVGALDGTTKTDGDPSAWFSSSRTGPVAWFSNRGAWVTAWAPGVSLVTTHLDGLGWAPDPGVPASPKLHGQAIVDGTSFAGPYVAALIAEKMASSGMRAQDAWPVIAVSGAAPLPPCTPGPGPIGGGAAVALTSITATATSPAAGAPPSC